MVRWSAMGFLGRRSFWLPLIVVTLCAVGFAFVIGGRRGEMAAIKRKEASLEAELASAQERNAALERERQQLLWDPVAIERVARDQYGFLREGEVSVDADVPPRPVLAASQPVKGLDQWDRLLGEGQFPWRLPVIVFAISAVVLGTLDAIGAGRRQSRTG